MNASDPKVQDLVKEYSAIQQKLDNAWKAIEGKDDQAAAEGRNAYCQLLQDSKKKADDILALLDE